VGGGLLAVADDLDIRYRIVARRWTPAAADLAPRR
jgi:hypothetical protein